MQKTARKPSSDPAQEKLRQEKAAWNKEVSSFINDLIHLKKTINGWASKFHMEKSFIKDPIPADPSTIIGSLAGDFQGIAEKANKIVQHQLEYSKSRRRKSNISPGTQTDLSKQLSLPGMTASQEYFLISEASNVISRFFTRLLNPGIGGSEAARIRKYRMSMLTASATLYKDLEKFQNAIVSSGPNSIFIAARLLSKIEDNWIFLFNGFNTYKSSMPKEVKDTGGTIEVKPPIDLKNKPAEKSPSDKPKEFSNQVINNIIADFSANSGNFLDLNLKPLRSIIAKYVKSEDKASLALSLIETYQTALAEANSKYKTNGDSLFSIWQEKNQKTASRHLEIVAQNFLTRWLGKTKHKLNPFDKTSATRLDIYNLIDEIKENVDKIMNSLEKDMNPTELDSLFIRVNSDLSSTRTFMRTLEATLRGQGFDRPFFELLEDKGISDRNIDLSDENRKRLQKMLDLKQLRELTHLYGRR